ncbi:hypothetical protein FRC12_013754 [Ceratobasidium sp. 428]|nr:hypothetical protein FRC12_013754 [Ceratobasidium sp. 428]
MSSAHSIPSTQSSSTSSSPSAESNDIPTLPPPVSAIPLTLYEALALLKSSPGWIGNSTGLMRDAEWVEDGRSDSMYFRIKQGTDVGSLPVDESGNVKVSWIGVVGAKDSHITPHADFLPHFRKLSTHKRVVRTIRPPSAAPEIDQLWNESIKGAKVMVERSRRMAEGGGEAKIGHCFLGDDGSIRTRSALFERNGHPWEGDTPEGFRYSTWKIPENVRTDFDGVRDTNFTPRVLEAYDALDNLIHPNDVAETLTGSLAYVTCTFERMWFKANKAPWQVYANLVKVQLIAPNPAPLLPVASSSKRKASELDDDDVPDRQPKRLAGTA